MTLRAVAASFNAIAMVALATTLSGGSVTSPHATFVLWGSAAAAVVLALVVLTRGPATPGWLAVGYVLAAALLGEAPYVLLLLLAVAYVPLLQRPRGSLALGLVVAIAATVAFRAALIRLL